MQQSFLKIDFNSTGMSVCVRPSSWPELHVELYVVQNVAYLANNVFHTCGFPVAVSSAVHAASSAFNVTSHAAASAL